MTQDGMPKNDLILKKIEALQLELQQNPRSLAFPQLADLYFNQDMFDEAFELLERGLKYHPHSVSAMIVLSKVLKQRGHFTEAEKQLSKAVNLAPQNWQAYLLRADLYVRQTQHKKALDDFKKVLIFNPTHPIARKAVAKLGMLTADSDIDADSSFQVASLQTISEKAESSELKNQVQNIELSSVQPFENTSPKLERILSLIDAFTMRQDYAKALKLLYECKSEFGAHSEIDQRLLKLSQFESAEKIRPKVEIKTSLAKHVLVLEKKQKALELLLRRITELKHTQLVHE